MVPKCWMINYIGLIACMGCETHPRIKRKHMYKKMSDEKDLGPCFWAQNICASLFYYHQAINNKNYTFFGKEVSEIQEHLMEPIQWQNVG